ncbi:MAG: FeoA family protein [Thermodesulfobacteriota bacterium]
MDDLSLSASLEDYLKQMEERLIPLGLLDPGEQGEVVRLISGKGSFHRLMDMGLRIGKRLEMLSNRGSGPVLIKIDGTRLALGRGVAMKILIRRVSP